MILGIETSCDETAAAVLDANGAVLSNVVASQRIHELNVPDGQLDFVRAERSDQLDLSFTHRFPAGLDLRDIHRLPGAAGDAQQGIVERVRHRRSIGRQPLGLPKPQREQVALVVSKKDSKEFEVNQRIEQRPQVMKEVLKLDMRRKNTGDIDEGPVANVERFN